MSENVRYNADVPPRIGVNRREFMGSLMRNMGVYAFMVWSALTTNFGGAEEVAMHTGKKNIQRLIDDSWESQDEVYSAISVLGFQRYYNKLPDKKMAFFSPEDVATAERCSCCSDEGNTQVLSAKGKKEILIRTPGSGILQALDVPGKNPFDPDFINKVAQEAVDNGVTHFTAHSGCGAAKAVLIAWLMEQGDSDKIASLTQKDIDDFADEWARAVTKKMKELDPKRAEIIHEDLLKNLDRPTEIHVARCLYLTDVDEFDASYRGLPQGFVERTGEKEDLHDVLNHVDVLRSIAFDEEHGFGKKFGIAAQEQFVICCIARTSARLEKLKTDAKKKVQSLPPEIAKKIRIDGFLALAA